MENIWEGKSAPYNAKLQQNHQKEFLKSTLPVFKSSTKFDEIEILSKGELEDQVYQLVQSGSCPKLIQEEFLESQEQNSDDDDNMQQGDIPSNELHLGVEPYDPPIDYPQDDFMIALGPIAQEKANECTGEIDYHISFQDLAKRTDWSEDKIKLDLSDHDVENLKNWLPDTKVLYENSLRRSSDLMHLQYEKNECKAANGLQHCETIHFVCERK